MVRQCAPSHSNNNFCSEEPVVTLSAKKTRTALICRCTCVQIVQRQLYAACCYVASCTVDLRTTQTYRQLCFDLPRLKACSSHSLETARRRPCQVATVTRTLKLTLKNLSEEVEIENKTSYIVEKPCLTSELLDSDES